MRVDMYMKQYGIMKLFSVPVNVNGFSYIFKDNAYNKVQKKSTFWDHSVSELAADTLMAWHVL